MEIIETIKGLNNENIIKVYDVLNDQEREEINIVMELCDFDLKKLIMSRKDQNTGFTLQEVISYMK